MFCGKCGNLCNDESKFCNKCGNDLQLGKTEKIVEQNNVTIKENDIFNIC